jgi:hypothetical protein
MSKKVCSQYTIIQLKDCGVDILDPLTNELIACDNDDCIRCSYEGKLANVPCKTCGGLKWAHPESAKKQ